MAQKDFEMCLAPFFDAMEICSDKVFVERAIEKVFTKYAQQYSPECQTGPESKVFSLVSTKRIQEMIFDVASKESTRQLNRELLYASHKVYQRTLRVQGKRSADEVSTTQTANSVDAKQDIGTENSSKTKKSRSNEKQVEKVTSEEPQVEKSSKAEHKQKTIKAAKESAK